MNFVRLLPVLISFLLLSAHFSRLDIPILSLLLLLFPFLLLIRKKWIAKLFKLILIIGAFEWLRSLLVYTYQRQLLDQPYLRLVIIIGIVALFTGLSSLVFRNKKLKDRYNIQ